MKNRIFNLLSFLLLFGGSLAALEQTVKSTQIDATLQEKLANIDSQINKAMEMFNIPGVAIGIVVDGKVIYTKGYGIRNQTNPLPVTENTLFAIGSCSKAFTTFALGQLVEKGLIAWDDPVIKYIPEFRLHDHHATHHMTIRDLVTHRSGLPRHDLVWFNSKFPRLEFLNRLPFLEPTYDLREKFQYNNIMYAVAGLLIERVTGKSWEEFVQAHIFDSLGMKNSNFSVEDSKNSIDFADPHTEKNKQNEVIPFRNLENIGPAGSINSSAYDMVKWLQLQLSDGTWQGKPLIKSELLNEMHLIQMPMSYGSPQFGDEPDLFGYGLGWMIGLYKGYYTVTHDGGIDGFVTSVVLIPQEKIGVIVLTNSDSHPLFPYSAAYGIVDILMGLGSDAWLLRLIEQEKQMNEMQKASEDLIIETQFSLPLESYIGEFEHPGYGTVQISLENGSLIATLNEISFQLKYINCSFTCSTSGEVTEFHIALEPLLKPIVFKRKN